MEPAAADAAPDGGGPVARKDTRDTRFGRKTPLFSVAANARRDASKCHERRKCHTESRGSSPPLRPSGARAWPDDPADHGAD